MLDIKKDININVIKQDTHFLTEISVVTGLLTVKEVCKFIDTYQDKMPSIYDDYINDREGLYELFCIAGIPITYPEKQEEVITEKQRKDDNLFTSKLFWILLLCLAFMFGVAVMLSQSLARASVVNSVEQMVDEYHTHLSAALEQRDAILDSIFNNYINKDSELNYTYNNMADSIIDSEFNGKELLFISWVEFCRNFDLMDLDCIDVECYMGEPDFLVEKFHTFTDYLASDVIADHLQYWMHEDGGLTNIY